MVLIAHIVIVLTSIIFASYLLVKPSRTKFYANYGLIAGTIVSGTYLIISTGAAVLSSCMTGLTYLTIVAVLTAVAQRRYAIARAHTN